MYRKAIVGLVAVGTVLANAPTAAADTYTKQFRGEGSSSFGFAWEYARWNAYNQAYADGFAEPFEQCAEIWAWGDVFLATVIWECVREV